MQTDNCTDRDWVFDQGRDGPILSEIGIWPFWDFGRGWDYKNKDKNKGGVMMSLLKMCHTLCKNLLHNTD